jgi:hypothetical protein
MKRTTLTSAVAASASAAAAITMLALPTTGAAANTASARGHTHPVIFVGRGNRPSFGPDNESLLYSNNWAGQLAVKSNSRDTFRYVSAEFSMPSLNCATTPGTGADGSDESQWVGLDGVGYHLTSGATVEQAGITGYCTGTTPAYYAWSELYPRYPVEFSMTVNPGDAIRATVSEAGGVYTMTVDDITAGVQQTETGRCPSGSHCYDASAEVISEAPSDSSGVLPLADFGISSFSAINVHAAVPSKIVGGGFGSKSWRDYELDQVSAASGTTLDSVGTLYAGGAFSDTWRAEG